MNIAKYDIPQSRGNSASTGTTAVAGATAGTDIGPITEKVAELEAELSQLRLQLTRVTSVLSGLDTRFLSKLGDRSDYSYTLGALYSDFIQSSEFQNGVGFRLSGNATAAVDEKYNLVFKDVGWSSVAYATTWGSAVMVDSDTDEATAQLSASRASIGPSYANGFILIEAGAELTNDRCFTPIATKVEYSLQLRVGQQIDVVPYVEASQDSNGRFIIRFYEADDVSIAIKLYYTFAFRKYGDMTSGTYRLYIRGTDYANGQTDCFATFTKVTTVNADGITVMNNQIGVKVSSDGIKRTTDGGSTWVV